MLYKYSNRRNAKRRRWECCFGNTLDMKSEMNLKSELAIGVSVSMAKPKLSKQTKYFHHEIKKKKS